jgi:hypothetical protein
MRTVLYEDMGIKSLIRYSISLLVSSGHILESTSNGVTAR